MVICYVNPDGSHVRGCDRHLGQHPYDWCMTAYERRERKIAELRAELHRLEVQEPDTADSCQT